MADRAAADPTRRLLWGGFWLGFALSGFFDGILLHQVLQWHHLLSGVAPSETPQDLRFQILADGLFHVSHYLFALLGLWLIWTRRAAFAVPGVERRFTGWALIGFGSWHVLDAVLSHWLLQIHRIRMDSAYPLFWDLAWLIPFGLAVLALGIHLLRSPPPGPGGTGRRAAVTLALAVLVAGPLAALPPEADPDGRTLVLFRPGISFAEVVAAADAVEGRLIWTDASEAVWIMALGPEASALSLYRHGALLVSRGPVSVGCLSWTSA